MYVLLFYNGIYFTIHMIVIIFTCWVYHDFHMVHLLKMKMYLCFFKLICQLGKSVLYQFYSKPAQGRKTASCLGISGPTLLFVLSFSMVSVIPTAQEVAHKQLWDHNSIFRQYSNIHPLKLSTSDTLLHITMSSLLWFCELVCLCLSFICPCLAAAIAHEEKFPTQLLSI